MNDAQVQELLYQALETEIGGQKVYETAIRCAQNPDLKKEWNKYLDETRNHEVILRETFARIGLDTEKETPGRAVVRHKGEALVAAMEMALDAGGRGAAQLVAAESVVEAETKDHQNWELIGEVAKDLKGERKSALRMPTRRSRTRKTSTSTTRWAGLASSGSSRSGCRPSCLRPRRRRRSRRPSAPPVPSRPARRCSSRSCAYRSLTLDRGQVGTTRHTL